MTTNQSASLAARNEIKQAHRPMEPKAPLTCGGEDPSVRSEFFTQTIRIVVAYAENRVIGRDNQLPWHLAGDLKHFRQTTLGHPIIMGRKTWESLGRALPGRHNIVVTRNRATVAEGATVVASLEEALRTAADDTVCVIGGAQLYAQALPIAHEIIATEVHAHITGDVFFPVLPAGLWHETARLPQPAENGLTYDFVRYRRAGLWSSLTI